MVSSQISGWSGPTRCKSFQTHLLLSVQTPDAVPSDGVEFDFSDVFGPLPIQTAIEVDNGDSVEESTDLLYDDPVVIYSRSHSLVGPTNCVSQSLKLSKLTLHETEESLELWESVSKDMSEEPNKLTEGTDSLLNPIDNIDQSPGSFAVGLEDFEVLKVVGQGAFGKVFQVRKRGTSEIYAMKVVRKDKIVEKNHVEYMKAERDILTKVDHPFIVQLKYSFQVMISSGTVY